ncbi:hypothetical protein H310_02643 [Aphanomyces invadans]|uniref:Peptidase S1 domain-containing protein n=1 Tax=Aphanomyces invadans TaxID=157072 RepID=A0A024UJL6_9STRA|nr:hypothetical protein H310_02643 [Aphanomyces invadans]ETW06365.1 hypothetical protein H310_02643 [Aphanomyces invadans]|eukprot:XP_008864440.1 hypothetical protein H310_02643 [Aphanomyces invadans]
MTTLLALAALSAFAAARPEIVGGTEVPLDQFKYVASLRDTESGDTLCGGTLISPTKILTAASCVDTSANYASIGSHNSIGDKDGERIKIVNSIMHPKFNDTTLEYDFAILELESESKFDPVALNWDAIEPDTETWVLGFGATSFFEEIVGKTATLGKNSPVLLSAKFNIWSNNECQKVLEGEVEVSESMLCAYAAGKSPCLADIGGPLIIKRDGVEYVAGVASWDSLCDSKYPSVYSRVSVAREFIQPHLAVIATQPENYVSTRFHTTRLTCP